MNRQQHYPGPLNALFVSMAAWFATALLLVLFGGIGSEGQLSIGMLGVSQALGLGVVTTLVARFVPDPQAERLGLRGFDRSLILPLLMLLPLSIVVSELHNLAQMLAPPPDAQEIIERTKERLDTASPLAALETAIVVVGIAPVVEEWLYRGVIQQGVVAHLGRVGGVLLTACLFGFAHFSPSLSAASSLATFAATLPVGLVLGVVRLGTGSLLAAIFVHATYNASGLLATAYADVLPIAGYNAPGDHTSVDVLLPSVFVIALAVVPLLRAARAAPTALPIPEPVDEADDEDSGWSL